MVRWIWAAGAIQLAIVLANFALPRRLRLREGLAVLPKFLRQVFLVHWFYILLVLLIFSALSFAFAGELAGGTPLGRFLSGAIALLWLLRFFLQLLYYDDATRRQFPWLDVAYSGAVLFLATVFGTAALGLTLR